MAHLFRSTFRLSHPQQEAVQAEAERLGIKAPELLRRIVDEWRERNAATKNNQPTQGTNKC